MSRGNTASEDDILLITAFLRYCMTNYSVHGICLIKTLQRCNGVVQEVKKKVKKALTLYITRND